MLAQVNSTPGHFFLTWNQWVSTLTEAYLENLWGIRKGPRQKAEISCVPCPLCNGQ